MISLHLIRLSSPYFQPLEAIDAHRPQPSGFHRIR
jgi:hypothetical protein